MISVLKDPIFRVRNGNGEPESVGLEDLIRNAHTYRDLLARTPTGRCAVLRLCIAFLEDMLRPKDVSARQELFESGRFDADQLEEYVAECEKDGPRFLLDDPEHPFMQMPYASDLDAKAEKPIAALIMDVPAGNNHIHHDHRRETEHALNAADALEALLETYLFCPAGLAGPSNVNNTPPIYFLLSGRNLFETLVLNMVSAGKGEELQYIPFGAGEVPWRRNDVVRPKEQAAEMSLLRAFTWLPRRVTLKFDDDGMVRTCYLQPGLDFRGDGRWMDPHVAYFRKKDQTWGTLKPEPGRQVWRNVGNLLAGMPQTALRPVTVDNVSNVWQDDGSEPVRIEAAGIQTNQASFLGWTEEVLCMPQVFLRDAEKADAFRSCVDLIEETVHVMEVTIQSRLDPGADGKNKPYAQISSQACERFLQLMHDELFDRTMDRIQNWNADWKEAFAEALRQALREVLRDVVNQSGTSVAMLRRQEEVAGILMGYANKQLKGW